MCRKVGFFWLLSLFILSAAQASENYFSARLQVKGEYDSNVTFSYRDQEEDLLAIFSPSLFYNYGTERFSWYGHAGLDIYRYADLTRLNTENQEYRTKFHYKPGERWGFSGEAYIIKDTTLESELRETGIVRFREDRRRYGGSATLSYLFSEQTTLSLAINRLRTEYDWRYDVDYDYFSASLGLTHIRDGRNTLLGRFLYTNIDSDTSLVNNYGLLLGWKHAFSETSEIMLSAGVRYTVTDYYLRYQLLVFDPRLWPPFRVIVTQIKKTERDWGYLLDFNFGKRAERWQIRIKGNRDLSYSSYGEAVDRSRIGIFAAYNLDPRWKIEFSGGYYLTSSEGRVYEEDNIFYYLNPRLRYFLSERWSFILGYKYSYYRDKVRDRDYDRHRIGLALQFEFGKPPVLEAPW